MEKKWIEVDEEVFDDFVRINELKPVPNGSMGEDFLDAEGNAQASWAHGFANNIYLIYDGVNFETLKVVNSIIRKGEK